MPRNGSGTMSIPNSFTANTVISSADMNENNQDIATELTASLPINGVKAMTAPLPLASGTAALPSLTFSADTDTGIYRVGADQLGIAVAGVLVNTVASTGISGFGATPIGAVTPYAGLTAPSGWILCYGQSISRTTYAALFAIISTTYGTGDGSTTFDLPDLRGRTIAGQDDMGGSSSNRLTGVSGSVNGDTLGGTGGAETVALTTAQLASHTHTDTTDNDNANHQHVYTIAAARTTTLSYTPGATELLNVWNGTTTDTTGSQNANHQHTLTTDTAGSGSAHHNVQPTIILNYIIFAGV
jgi:microcystin-dependent protein